MSIEALLISEGVGLLFGYLKEYVDNKVKTEMPTYYIRDKHCNTYIVLDYAYHNDNKLIIYVNEKTGKLHYISLEDFSNNLEFI